MQSVIRQIYSGELCPAERPKVCITEFYTAKNAAIQAHDAFEKKVVSIYERGTGRVSFQRVRRNRLSYGAGIFRRIQVRRTANAGGFGGGKR